MITKITSNYNSRDLESGECRESDREKMPKIKIELDELQQKSASRLEYTVQI